MEEKAHFIVIITLCIVLLIGISFSAVAWYRTNLALQQMTAYYDEVTVYLDDCRTEVRRLNNGIEQLTGICQSVATEFQQCAKALGQASKASGLSDLIKIIPGIN